MTEPSNHSADKASREGTAAVLSDGRTEMRKLFVEACLVAAEQFDRCWAKSTQPPSTGMICVPLIQLLADECRVPIEESLQLIAKKSRVPVLPADQYDVDAEYARNFPAELCRR